MMKSAQILTVSCLVPAFKKLGAIALFSLPIMLISGLAEASQDISRYAEGVGARTNGLAGVFNYVSYMIGAISIGLGVSDARKSVENSQQAPWKNTLAKLFTGGLFLSLPFIAGVVSGTMTGKQAFALTLAKTFTFSGPDIKGGLGEYINNATNNAAVFINVAAFLAFLIAVFFTIRGIQLVRNHIENPGQAPLAEGLKRLAVGGALFSFPMIVGVVAKTFGAQGKGIENTGWSSKAGTGAEGLDGMMMHFISDISNPAYHAIEYFCYIAGILMVFFAMQRLVRTAQDGPRGPLTFGTITMFVVAGALLSFPQLLTSLNMSLAGGTSAQTSVSFMAMTGVDAAQVQNAKNVFSAILAFMAVIGFLSVVRGLFLLKSFADGGQQASMMSVVTHIVAGSLCINLGAFINAVQTSLGVTDFPVTFR